MSNRDSVLTEPRELGDALPGCSPKAGTAVLREGSKEN